MGVWHTLFIASRSKPALTATAFNALLVDLVEHHIVSPPCALIQGQIDYQSPLGIANLCRGYSAPTTDATRLVYQGDDSDALLDALATIPFEETDWCVWFQGLDHTNAVLWQDLTAHGNVANADVVVYGLARPREIVVGSAYDARCVTYHLRHYLAITGKGGPHTIKETLIESILAPHFGSNLLVDCSYT